MGLYLGSPMLVNMADNIGEGPTVILYSYTYRDVGTPRPEHTIKTASSPMLVNMTDNIGEGPTVILYTYTYRDVGTPRPEHTIKTASSPMLVNMTDNIVEGLTVIMYTVSKHDIQPEYGDEQADAGLDCRTRLARPSSQARTQARKFQFSLFS